MAQQLINSGETGLVVRTKLNENFSELYEKSLDYMYGWGYQDFEAGVIDSTSVTITDNQNGEVTFDAANLNIGDSAVIVRASDTNTVPYTGTTTLFSSKVKTLTQTGASVTLSGIPHPTWGTCRIYYYYKYETFPVGYTVAPEFVSAQKLDALDTSFVTDDVYNADLLTLATKEELAALEPASGGYSNNLYFDETASDVVGYETLTYTPSAIEITETHTVQASDGIKLLHSYLYPTAVATTLMPAGLWSFTFYGSVDSSSGDTRLGVTYFRRLADNSEVDLFTVWSDEINNTTNEWIKFNMTEPSYTLVETDRMGARVKIQTTRNSVVTLTYFVGDGYGAFINNPNKIRHSQLRDWDGDSNYQHIASTVKGTLVTQTNANTVDYSLVATDGTTGRRIRQGLATTNSDGDINIPSGRTYKINNVSLLNSSLLSGSIGATGTIPVSAGSTSNFNWETPLSAIGSSLTQNYFPIVGATKLENSLNSTDGTSTTFVGGTAAGSKITYKSTTGAGTTTGIAHQWVGGTNGGTVLGTILNDGKWGLGTISPVVQLEVSGNSAGTIYTTNFSNDAVSPGLFGRKARGTDISPSAVLSGDNLMGFGGLGYNGSAFSTSKAAIFFDASQNWTTSNNGTQIRFATTANNSTTRTDRILISNDGTVAIGTTDLDGTPAIGRLTVKGSTNDGTTNALVLRDSDEANILSVNTNGDLISIGSQESIKVKQTVEGGIAVKLTNKTGANSVKGTVVYADPAVDNAFEINPIDGDMPFGVVYDNGIADGSECWVIVSGIAEVLLVNTVASTRSYIAYSSASVAGRIDTAAAAPAATLHFREIGHTLESKVGGTNVLCKCVLHFN